MQNNIKSFLDSWDITLNDHQMKIVEDVCNTEFGLHIVGEAVPGSGKTTTIVAAIHTLMYKNQISDKHILACCFNRETADVLRVKLAKLSGTQRAAFNDTARTYHSVGLEICKEHGKSQLKEFHYSAVRQAMNSCNKTFSTKYDEKDVFSLICLFKNKGYYIDGNNIVDNLGNIVKIEESEEYIYKTYESLKGEDLDYDDLVLYPYVLLKKFKNGEYNKNPFRKFHCVQYLFIDELQDINIPQMEMIKAIQEISGCKIIGLGDQNQSMYAWRGAGTDNISEFTNMFSAIKYPIQYNYRSGKNILDSAAELMKYKNNDYRIIGKRTDIKNDGELIQINRSCTIDEFSGLFRVICTLVSQHDYKYNDIFVISRTNAILQLCAGYLTSAGIPVVYCGEDKNFELSQFTNSMAAIYGHENTDMYEIFRYVNSISNNNIESLVSGVSDLSELNISAVNKNNKELVDFIDFLQLSRRDVLESTSKYDVFLFQRITKELCKRLNSFSLLLGPEKSANIIANNNIVYKQIDTLALQYSIQECMDRMYVAINSSLQNQDIPSVKLMTSHKSKGLENKVVCIIDGDSFPCQTTIKYGGDYDQEVNMLFVSITRAMEKLYVFKSESDREKTSLLYENMHWTHIYDATNEDFVNDYCITKVPEQKQENSVVSNNNISLESWPVVKEYVETDSFYEFRDTICAMFEKNNRKIYFSSVPCAEKKATWLKLFPKSSFDDINDFIDRLSFDDCYIDELDALYKTMMSKGIKDKNLRVESQNAWLTAASMWLSNKFNFTPVVFSNKDWVRNITVQKDFLFKIADSNLALHSDEVRVVSLILTCSGHPKITASLSMKISDVKFSLNKNALRPMDFLHTHTSPVSGILPYTIWKSENTFGKSTKANDGYIACMKDIIEHKETIDNFILFAINNMDKYTTIKRWFPYFLGHTWNHLESDCIWPIHKFHNVLVENMSGRQEKPYDPISGKKMSAFYDMFKSDTIGMGMDCHIKHMQSCLSNVKNDKNAIEALVALFYEIESSQVNVDIIGKTAFVSISKDAIKSTKNISYFDEFQLSIGLNIKL